MSGWGTTGWRVILGQDEEYEYYWNNATKYRRLITLKRAVWRGLSRAGSLAKAATPGWRITARNRVDESGQYHVAEEKKTEGSWEVVS